MNLRTLFSLCLLVSFSFAAGMNMTEEIQIPENPEVLLKNADVRMRGKWSAFEELKLKTDETLIQELRTREVSKVALNLDLETFAELYQSKQLSDQYLHQVAELLLQKDKFKETNTTLLTENGKLKVERFRLLEQIQDSLSAGTLPEMEEVKRVYQKMQKRNLELETENKTLKRRYKFWKEMCCIGCPMSTIAVFWTAISLRI